MTEHADQLRQAFETHENQTPDAAAVYARVQEMSTKYKRRRRGLQVTGGVALAGLAVAGVVSIPQLLPGNAENTSTAAFPAGAVPSSAAATALSEADLQKAYAAYTAAGYGYDDAQKLAKIWHVKSQDFNKVKADAGRRLLAGQTLPIPPTPDVPVVDVPVSPQDEARFSAFFHAGYVYDDAVKLAKIWHIKDPADAKLMAGKKLLAHETLPVKPKPANVAEAKEAQKVETFFAKGYDVDDAIQLAKLWHLKTAYQAKVEGGKRLMAGQTLPIKP